MPLALRTAKVSCLPLKSCAISTRFACDQALLIIGRLMNLSGSTASGASSWISSVCSSTFFAAITPLSWKLRCDGGVSARCTENTASSTVNGVPSWKTTPWRSLKRQVLASTWLHDTASDGSGLNFSSRLTSES